jgi:uncharacterized membrane protein
MVGVPSRLPGAGVVANEESIRSYDMRPVGSRIRTLDAARGSAMVLVCLSHFTSVYFRSAADRGIINLPMTIGMIASPTFIIVSGTMLGLLYATRPKDFPALRRKLVDRSLFVLTFAHVLIACSRLVYEQHAVDALRMSFMTDAVAVAVLVGLLSIDRITALGRALAGPLMLGLTWILVFGWQPHSAFAEAAKELLVGAMPDRVLVYTVPIIPWLGVYLAATAFGQHLGALYARGASRLVEWRFLSAGIVAIAGGVCIRVVGWKIPRDVLHPLMGGSRFEAVFSPSTKLPPGPAYVLFFGGLGLVLISALAFADHRDYLPRMVDWLGTVGRSSLAVFIAQFYLYYTVLGLAHVPYSPAWPLLFAATLVAIGLFARWWDARRLNVVFTVGWPGAFAWLDGWRPNSPAFRTTASADD